MAKQRPLVGFDGGPQHPLQLLLHLRRQQRLRVVVGLHPVPRSRPAMAPVSACELYATRPATLLRGLPPRGRSSLTGCTCLAVRHRYTRIVAGSRRAVAAASHLGAAGEGEVALALLCRLRLRHCQLRLPRSTRVQDVRGTRTTRGTAPKRTWCSLCLCWRAVLRIRRLSRPCVAFWSVESRYRLAPLESWPESR